MLVSELALDMARKLGCSAHFAEHDDAINLVINLEYNDYFRARHSMIFCFKGYPNPCPPTDQKLEFALLACQKSKPE
jgi:hypothetical protein